MELEQHEWDKSEVYLSSFDTLIGDKRYGERANWGDTWHHCRGEPASQP